MALPSPTTPTRATNGALPDRGRPDAGHHLGPAGDTAALIAHAVREGATRALVAAGLGGVIVIHVLDSIGKWSETRYVFWMYMAAIVAAIGAAGWTLFSRSRMSLLAAAAISGGVLIGFVVNRTVGLPNATDDIGNWTEPLGLASMVVEAATVVVALSAAAVSARGDRS